MEFTLSSTIRGIWQLSYGINDKSDLPKIEVSSFRILKLGVNLLVLVFQIL